MSTPKSNLMDRWFCHDILRRNYFKFFMMDNRAWYFIAPCRMKINISFPKCVVSIFCCFEKNAVTNGLFLWPECEIVFQISVEYSIFSFYLWCPWIRNSPYSQPCFMIDTLQGPHGLKKCTTQSAHSGDEDPSFQILCFALDINPAIFHFWGRIILGDELS
jgi:hypothetical protein